jgi:Gpi18-like mannosyltransferase
MVLLPTVVINASLYGQMDSMWAAFAVGGVYYLLRDKPWHAVAFCTAALAVKPQGIFVFPVLLLLALAGRLPWRTLLAAPAVFVALDLPAMLAGRDPIELLTIYDMGRQARHVPGLSLRAPSLYAFIPPGGPTGTIRMLGYVFTAAIVLGICWVLIARAVEMTRERIVLVATLFALLLPFLLPGMHERYFFLADVTTLVLAVYRPRLWFVPLIVQAASLLAYERYLIGSGPLQLPMTVPATMMLGAVVVVGYVLLRDAFAEPAPDEPEAGAESLDAEWAAELLRLEPASPPAATPEPLPVRPA